MCSSFTPPEEQTRHGSARHVQAGQPSDPSGEGTDSRIYGRLPGQSAAKPGEHRHHQAEREQGMFGVDYPSRSTNIQCSPIPIAGKGPPSGRHPGTDVGGIAHHAGLQHRRVENVPEVSRAGSIAAERTGNDRSSGGPAKLGGYLIFSVAEKSVIAEGR